MAKTEISVQFTSRYKKTPVYSQNGRVLFGIWKPPNILLDGNEKVITVEENDEGFLDLISYREYGDRSLWWAIAYVNRIKYPPEEIVAGLQLTIPKLENIRAALLETENDTNR